MFLLSVQNPGVPNEDAGQDTSLLQAGGLASPVSEQIGTSSPAAAAQPVVSALTLTRC